LIVATIYGIALPGVNHLSVEENGHAPSNPRSKTATARNPQFPTMHWQAVEPRL
jgi:hypothetical protein